ncbi:MAG: thioredoxin-disulfide reductase [Gemmatimonadetes bacterium]|nr:thioredoxin-disulfide reductase [Gemmatimonadota bacterium]
MPPEDRRPLENVVILGSGCAGLTAAIYAARANLEPLVVMGVEMGGQLSLTTDVENYPGFPEGVQGPELIDLMRRQAERFGARFAYGDATAADLSERPFIIEIEGEPVRTKALIVCSGASARMLGIPGEKRLLGHGVSTCATCDGAFFRDQEVIVVGGGDSAMEEAIFLTRFASRVYVVHRREALRASKIMQDRAFANEKIEFLWNTHVVEVLGDPEVEAVRLWNSESDEKREIPIDGVFIAIGHVPNTEIFERQLPLDAQGYLVLKEAGRSLTEVDGVFAGGDVHDHFYRQAVTAAAAGCRAAMDCEKYLERVGEAPETSAAHSATPSGGGGLAGTMRAVVKVGDEGGREGTELRDVPIPEPGPGEARLKVLACAICGSDRHIWHWDESVQDLVDPPRVYGHEFCGEIDAVGASPGRDDLAPGAYASAEMHVTCGTCRQCRAGQGHVCARTEIIGFHRDGTFAEYVVVPTRNVVILDRQVVPPKVGAFLDALGNAVHTVQDHDLTGASVAILGYGPIGAMAAAIAEHERASRIYVLDVSEAAIEQAERWKAERSAHQVTVLKTGRDVAGEVETRILDETVGGVDLVLEMSGAAAAINQGLRLARMGGSMSLLGLPTDEAVTIERFAHDLVFKGLTLNAIIGRRIFSTWERMLALLASGLDVTSLVTHEHESLEAFPEAMEAFDSHEALKTVLYPNGQNGQRNGR